MKRWIAALLTVAMLMGCLPLNALAAGMANSVVLSAAEEKLPEQQAMPETTVQMDKVTVEATNSFGKLLLDSMDETNGGAEAGQYNENNKIISVKVTENTQYGTNVLVDARGIESQVEVIVALYAEDGLEMLSSAKGGWLYDDNSGKSDEDTWGTIQLFTLSGSRPDRFVIKTYLLNAKDHTPLCPADSILLDSTVAALGDCGVEGKERELTWILDVNRLLTISGAGEMKDYDGFDAPWENKKYFIEEVQILEGVTSVGEHVFDRYSTLKKATISESVTNIGSFAFFYCDGLTEVTIPESVTSIGESAFDGCANLKDVYYGGSEEQWKAISVGQYNYKLTGATIHYNSTGPDDSDATTNGIFPGSTTEETVGWQASFENLIPNTEYAVIVSRSADAPLEWQNLQYITQAAADENGELTVYYRQSDPVAAPYVVACGPSEADLEEPPKPEEPSNPGTTPGGSGGSSGSSGGSGGGSDGGAAAVLLLAGVGAVAAVVVVKAILPVEVSGTVTDETGAALPGATVALWQNGAIIQQTVTDENGWYTVKVKKGGYDLVASYIDPATGTAFQQTVTITAPDKERHVTLDLSPLKVPAAQA